ncbi:MAG: hypothetical protein K0S00_4085 [Xanthobacteraceae bacterium]|jgi:hypothetical protein|nr:hypothetical protein [Xanthobacteraceae bacterium]
MNSFSDLLTALGPLQIVGDRFGVTAQAVSNMKIRNAVNSRYWPTIVEMAAERGIPGITFDYLVELDRRARLAVTLSPAGDAHHDNQVADFTADGVAP